MVAQLKAYDTIAINAEVNTGLSFNEALIMPGHEVLFWHMSQVQYFNNADKAKEYYAANKDYVLSIRIFNEAEEYYFWRNGNTLTGRHRKDEVSNAGEQHVIDTEMVLRTVVANQKGNAEGKKWFLKTRNYISNEGFGYSDSRFLQIIKK